MKRISTSLALCLALGNPSSIIASPLVVAAALAQICSPYLGKMMLPDRKLAAASIATIMPSAITATITTTSHSTEAPVTYTHLTPEQIRENYTREHQKGLKTTLERFTKARKAVFGQNYQAWKESVDIKEAKEAKIYFAIADTNDEKFLTTVGLYYKSNAKAAPILLQRRRVDLPKSTMPKKGDKDYNNDQKYIEALTTDIQRYIEVSTTDIESYIKNGDDVVEIYRKQTQLVESTL